MKNPKFNIKDITLDYIDKKYNFTCFEKEGGDKFNHQIFSKTKIFSFNFKKSEFRLIS